MTTMEAKEKLDALKIEVAGLETKLDSLTNQSNMVDQDTMNKARKIRNENIKVAYYALQVYTYTL